MGKGVIFDMDGVIIDSEPINQRAVDVVLEQYGKRLTDEQNQHLIGLGDKPFFEEIIRMFGLQTTWQALAMSWHDAIIHLMQKEGIAPIDGVRDVIHSLHQKKYRLAVASSGSRRRVGFILKALDLQGYFSSVITADDVMHAKPDPEIYLTAAARLNLAPQDCVAIEDSDRGVEAAKRAGVKVIGFLNPNSYNQQLNGADAIIHSFNEWRDELLH